MTYYYHCLMAVVCIVEVSHYVNYGHNLIVDGRNSYLPLASVTRSNANFSHPALNSIIL